MGTEKSELEKEKDVAREIRESMQKRGIVNVEGHLTFLYAQKIKKRTASKGRVLEAEMELRAIEKMLKGVI